MIEVKNVIKTYGDRYAVNNLSFKINPGEVVGLLGPNGAGKSTTMKIITGYMSPTSGTAYVCGFDVFENPLEVKKRIGYLPENPPLYLDMTVEAYLKYVAELKQVPARTISSYIESALGKTQLKDVRQRMIRNLSKGFKQRVGIAQALVSQPEILILDEPTVGLDPKQVAEIRDLINQLKGQHTIILSTHILSEVQATCNKIIIIHQGRMVLQEGIDNLQASSQSQTQLSLKLRNEVNIVPEVEKIKGVLGVKQVSDKTYLIRIQDEPQIINQILNQVMQQQGQIMDFTVRENNLEDIFLRLTYESSL